MSTKINVRSPFYLNYSEPVAPEPEFTCSYANLQNFAVDESGTVSLPTTDYGAVESYTSSDSDFANGSFDEVLVATDRDVDFTIIAPQGFSNAGDAIVCTATATQNTKAAACAAVVSATGSIPNQALDVSGDSVTIDYSSYFTGSTSDFTDIVINSVQNKIDTSLNTADEEITITSKDIAGSFTIQLERIDNSTGCSAKQLITTVVTATAAFDCTAANLLGGSVASDGTLTTPSSLGTITATKETSGGSSVTSIAPNNTGSDISVTLYYDVTAPAGYTNTGSTIECSKTYTQRSNTVTPTFTCADVDLDDQAILIDGSVVAGVAKWHAAPLGKSDPEYYLTIESFTPTKFDVINTTVKRDVTFEIEVPTGFTNTGSYVYCTESLWQPAQEILDTPCSLKTQTWYIGSYTGDDYTTFDRKNIQVTNLAVKAQDAQAPSAAWEGKTLCYFNKILTAPNGNHTYIRSTPGSTLIQANTNYEYVLVFGSNNTIKAVYFKDWITKQIRRI